MLWQRLLFGGLMIAALLGLLHVDDRLPEWLRTSDGGPQWDGVLVAAVVMALIVLATRELAALFRAAGHRPLVVWPAMISALLVLVPFLHRNRLAGGALPADATADGQTVTLLVIGLFGTAVLIASRKQTQRAIADLSVSLWPILYLGLLGQFIVALRTHPTGSAGLVLYYVATVKICDIGAYFTGLAIGRHKLIVWLSPKKTWEGLIGGIIASVAFAVAIAWMMSPETATMTAPAHGPWPTPVKAAVFGLLMALCGQAGDLLESLIKRDAQSKDSAHAIPAFGGVLDILDSILITAPIAYLVLLK